MADNRTCPECGITLPIGWPGEAEVARRERIRLTAREIFVRNSNTVPVATEHLATQCYQDAAALECADEEFFFLPRNCGAERGTSDIPPLPPGTEQVQP